MIKKITGLLHGGIFFTFATMIEALAPLILAPFLTRHLSLYEYGLWAIFQSAVAFLRPVMGLALDDYIRIHYHRSDKLFIIQYIVAILLLSTLLVAGACGLILLSGGDIGELLHFPQSSLWNVIACAWLYALFYIGLTYHQFAGNYMYYSFIQLLQAGVAIACTVTLVLSDWGWSGAVFGKIIGLALGCLLAFGLLLRNLPPFKFHWHVIHFGRLLSFGVRYLPSGMLMLVLIMIDRLMLSHMISVEASSLYAVASLFPMLLMIAIRGFILGWQPWCFKRLGTPKPGYLHEIGLGALLYFTVLPIGGFILFYICRWLGPWVIGASFAQAFDYVFILIMAMVVQGFYMLAQSFLQYFQKIGLLSCIALAAIALKIALNYTLIGTYGVEGAAIAMMLAYGMAFTAAASIAFRLLRTQAVHNITSIT